jgi:hypothetical protein
LTLTTRGGATGAFLRWQGGSGGGAGPAFVVGLLGVASRSRTRGAVGRQQGATQARTTPARTPGRCAVEIGAMVLATDVQGHPEW